MGFLGFGKKAISKKTAAARETLGRIENKDTVEAGIALGVWVTFADKKADESELLQLEKCIKNEDAFQTYIADVPAMIDKWIGKFKDFHRGAVLDAKKEIADLKGDPTNAAKVLVIGLSVADDDGIGEDEKAVLNEAATILGLRLENYL